MTEEKEPESIVDELVDALTNNQKILDGDQELTIKDLRKFMGDINFSLLEIVKKIKDSNEVGEDEIERVKERTVGMYAWLKRKWVMRDVF